MCSSFSQAYVDKAFNNEILALDVKCKNSSELGCKWEGEFQHYQVKKKNDFGMNKNALSLLTVHKLQLKVTLERFNQKFLKVVATRIQHTA